MNFKTVSLLRFPLSALVATSLLPLATGCFAGQESTDGENLDETQSIPQALQLQNAQQVITPVNAHRVAAGFNHTCAITAQSNVRCWGWNKYGQLGNGTTSDSNKAVLVSGLTGAVSVSAGFAHSCALLGSGEIKCWGSKTPKRGVLWLESTPPTSPYSTTPVKVTLPYDARASSLSVGHFFTCAVATSADHPVYCWGDNEDGQLGDGTMNDHFAPGPVLGLPSNIVAVYAGGYHTCARTADAKLLCWGANNDGELGNGTTGGPLGGVAQGIPGAVKVQISPNFIADFGQVESADLGTRHTCAVKTGGGLFCWGSNTFGVLGVGQQPSFSAAFPLQVNIAATTTVSAADVNTCAVTAQGTKCWGYGNPGSIGNGSLADQSTPAGVLGLDCAPGSPSPCGLSTGQHHSCVITAAGGVKCWGLNSEGQVGSGQSKFLYNTPVDVVNAP